ncbi:MAG: HAD family hydrolase [Oscillospiraceae bacterium]|nr:HAD family hydrolase [Oscillospiraceae bacterium]
MNFQKVRAVLFDLDGTLLDTIHDIGACLNEAMNRYGYPERQIEEFKQIVGHGARTLVRDALPEGVADPEIDKVWHEYVLHYRANCARYTKVYPGVPEFLAYLKQRGLKIGVITNKTQPTAEKIMAAYLPDAGFEILWGNNGERPLKPSLESAELACKTMGVTPEQVLFVGDGDTDMEFASKAGFLACGITWGYRPRQTLIDYGADFLVDSMAELHEKMQQG